MNRRHFLRSAGALSTGFVFSESTSSLAEAIPPDVWRTFEVKTRVEILQPSGTTRVWLPAALLGKTPFQRTLSNECTAPGGTARIIEGSADGIGIIVAEFPAGAKPVLTLTSRVATRNYIVDLSTPREARKRTGQSWIIFSALQSCCRPTAL